MFSYQAYWRLDKKPFENTPDPSFLYYSKQHKEALLRLVYSIEQEKGAAMLTGIFGCGKTLLGQALLTQLSEYKYRLVNILNPQLDAMEMLMSIATQLGAQNFPQKKSEVLINNVLDSINQILLDNIRDGKGTIVIIDEAHLISDVSIFEQLRLLLNFQLKDRFLLTLLLFGQPELREKILAIKQFEQRIPIKCHLESLDREDTEKYIIHRLTVAGRSGALFTDEAITLIFEHSGGIPRRINNLCDMCLFSGYTYEKDIIDDEIVRKEIKDLVAN
ncbi:MAG: AAA family ATPase [Candidatus Omnitrophota bacterium]